MTQPLLDGAEARRALDVVAEIAAVLAPPGPLDADPRLASASLARGAAGVALFLAELALATGDEGYADAATHHLDVAIDAAAAAPPSASLYGGSVGVGWLLTHLDGRLVDARDAADDVDELVHDTLAEQPRAIDLTDGLAGLGVYLLARLPRPAARRGLEQVVRAMAAAARYDDGRATWFVAPEEMLPEELERYPAGYHSAGMAHGQAGAVALLARLHGLGVDGAGPLLAAATAGLIGWARPDQDAVGRYPALVPPGGRTTPGSRVAWCYGDPGVATALLAAGWALDDEAVVAEGVATARAAALRPVDGAQVVDSGLCHGAAGLLHLFGRLAAATGDEACRTAALTWYGVLLGQRADGGVAGFRAIFDSAAGLEPAGSFLEGAAGVGLALLSATQASPPSWDVLLLA